MRLDKSGACNVNTCNNEVWQYENFIWNERNMFLKSV